RGPDRLHLGSGKGLAGPERVEHAQAEDDGNEEEEGPPPGTDGRPLPVDLQRREVALEVRHVRSLLDSTQPTSGGSVVFGERPLPAGERRPPRGPTGLSKASRCTRSSAASRRASRARPRP